jgi:hypothetical protein
MRNVAAEAVALLSELVGIHSVAAVVQVRALASAPVTVLADWTHDAD